MLKGLIFDFDGLILDTETPEYQALNAAYESYGQHLPVELYGRVVGAEYGQEFEPVAYLTTLKGKPIDAKLFWEQVNRQRMAIINQGQPLHYAVNAGQPDITVQQGSQFPADYASNGVFMNRFTETVWHTQPSLVQRISKEFISRGDGVSTTLMLLENNQSGSWSYRDMHTVNTPNFSTAEVFLGALWHPQLQQNPAWRINGDPQGPRDINHARPSSYHPGGVNVMFCDGRHKFINDTIDYWVFCLLMTPNGSRCDTPGTSVPDNDPNHNYFYLRHQVLDERDYQ